ncbi:Flp pilus assembly protein TadG [Mesorhizobium soli]|uniref:TadE/TadG family type IV pilus assembly protein n=1 Tax=Pseudaminobacter soli (ex Li et al. 2025) TaxID=1295366 RepID=UPI0024748211|nr:pilus assembly protein TadG-related protein [Mesorhizobium soli]MDH6234875.1 Flp pilus assembly protein TadG [Mesorhizobium soli]
MLQTLRAFWQDQRGMALILVAILLPVIIGFSLLVIDMSRANTLHNDLQKAADAFALAAAVELSWARADDHSPPAERQIPLLLPERVAGVQRYQHALHVEHSNRRRS